MGTALLSIRYRWRWVRWPGLNFKGDLLKYTYNDHDNQRYTDNQYYWSKCFKKFPRKRKFSWTKTLNRFNFVKSVKNFCTVVFGNNRINVPPNLRELLNPSKDFHDQLGSFVTIGYLQSNLQTLDIYLGQVRPSLMLLCFSRISEFGCHWKAFATKKPGWNIWIQS